MEYETFIEQGLDGEAPLKRMLCKAVKRTENDKAGAVSVVFATKDKCLAKQEIHELAVSNPCNYYMVDRVPLNVYGIGLTHYPSIAITKSDLE